MLQFPTRPEAFIFFYFNKIRLVLTVLGYFFSFCMYIFSTKARPPCELSRPDHNFGEGNAGRICTGTLPSTNFSRSYSICHEIKLKIKLKYRKFRGRRKFFKSYFVIINVILGAPLIFGSEPNGENLACFSFVSNLKKCFFRFETNRNK
jgi:hypothetical protein